DACNNSSPTVQTITIQDTTPPLITGTLTPATVQGCDLSAAPAPATTVAELVALGVTIADTCTPAASLVVSHSDSSAGTCPLVITRTYSVTDACNNSSPTVQTITIQDTRSQHHTSALTSLA